MREHLAKMDMARCPKGEWGAIMLQHEWVKRLKEPS